jgi:transposase
LAEFREKSERKILNYLKLKFRSPARAEVSSSFNLPYPTVCQIYNHFNRTGRTEALKRGGTRPKKLTSDQIVEISRWLEEECTLTLREIQRRIANDFAVEHYKILTGNGNTASFLDFLNELFKNLRDSNRENCILVMDNVRFHKVAEVKEAVLNAGHQIVFLPPYSPFFNPIENLFHQWKNIVRSAAPKCDDELYEAIRTVNLKVTAENCAAYCNHVFQNCISCIAGERNFNFK